MARFCRRISRPLCDHSFGGSPTARRPDFKIAFPAAVDIADVEALAGNQPALRREDFGVAQDAPVVGEMTQPAQPEGPLVLGIAWQWASVNSAGIAKPQ